MAELNEAFIGFTETNCNELKFDITPIGDDQHLGIVTLPSDSFASNQSSNNSESFSYRVYPLPFVPTISSFSFGADSTRHTTKVIEGNITKTNNMTFTFPIHSVTTNYFVLVTNSPTSDGSRGNAGPRDMLLREVPKSSFKSGETFAMFYPKKVIKAKRERLAKATKTKEETTTKNKYFGCSNEIPGEWKDCINQSEWKNHTNQFFPTESISDCSNVEWKDCINQSEWKNHTNQFFPTESISDWSNVEWKPTNQFFPTESISDFEK
jgi:hypothetical protein